MAIARRARKVKTVKFMFDNKSKEHLYSCTQVESQELWLNEPFVRYFRSKLNTDSGAQFHATNAQILPTRNIGI